MTQYFLTRNFSCTKFSKGKADKCAHCNEPIIKIEEKFTGAYFTNEKNSKIHAECWHQYQVGKLPL